MGERGILPPAGIKRGRSCAKRTRCRREKRTGSGDCEAIAAQEERMEFHHVPVLLDEALCALSPAAGQTFADGTLGGGGHSEAILRRIGANGLL